MMIVALHVHMNIAMVVMMIRVTWVIVIVMMIMLVNATGHRSQCGQRNRRRQCSFEQ